MTDEADGKYKITGQNPSSLALPENKSRLGPQLVYFDLNFEAKTDFSNNSYI